MDLSWSRMCCGDVDVATKRGDMRYNFSVMLCSNKQQLLKHIDMKLCGNVRRIFTRELVDVISHCVLLKDQFNLIVTYEPKTPIKIKSGIEINDSTMELIYTHIARRVVQVFALSRILDQLTRPIAISNK
jgi:hypothetical protein